MVEDRKPSQAHLRAYGCKAFALTKAARTGKNKKPDGIEEWNPKLNSKAWIGYLVGYNSTNIFRIWNPVVNKVVATRDVVFNEKEIFNGDLQSLKDDCIHIRLKDLQKLLTTIEEPDDIKPTGIHEDDDV